MRIWFSIFGAALALAAGGMVVSATHAQAPTAAKAKVAKANAVQNFYDFKLTALDGKPMPFSAYRGKVVLLVNTASFCGFTPQYEGLQKLNSELGPKGLVVVGIPSNDFNQEYDSNGKIAEFCEATFGVTFPMSEASHVKGPDAIPLYKWVKTEITQQNEPKWNFHKILIGRDGHVIAGFESKVTPESKELSGAIQKALGQKALSA